MAALTSGFSLDEDMQTLMPYLTINPADALEIYKNVLNEWGDEGFTRLLGMSPEAITAAVPPLTLQELTGMNPLSSDTGRFQAMQKAYMPLIHNLYQNIARRHGEAWASEFVTSFADLLPLALLSRDSRAAKIRRLLLDLANGDFFATILMPDACAGDQTNLKLFAALLASLAALNQNVNANAHALAALADWHEKGTLMPLVQHWLPYTTAKNFRSDIQHFFEPSENSKDEDLRVDAAFWQALTRLSLLRADLLPEQQEIFDSLAMNLMRPEVHPATTLNFLVEVFQPLFKVLQPFKFKQPEAVAWRLVAAGYPESSDPSLYEAYCKKLPEGQSDQATRAIMHRGSLSESELLRHGRTFADDHGGWSAQELWDVADTTLTIGGALVVTATTWGAASPLLVGAAARIGLKQAARQTAKFAAKALAKGVRMIPRAARPLVVKGAKYAYKGVKILYTPDYGAKTISGKAINAVTNSVTAYDTLNKLRSLLAPEEVSAFMALPEPVTLCPDRATQE